MPPFARKRNLKSGDFKWPFKPVEPAPAIPSLPKECKECTDTDLRNHGKVPQALRLDTQDSPKPKPKPKKSIDFGRLTSPKTEKAMNPDEAISPSTKKHFSFKLNRPMRPKPHISEPKLIESTNDSLSGVLPIPAPDPALAPALEERLPPPTDTAEYAELMALATNPSNAPPQQFEPLLEHHCNSPNEAKSTSSPRASAAGRFHDYLENLKSEYPSAEPSDYGDDDAAAEDDPAADADEEDESSDSEHECIHDDVVIDGSISIVRHMSLSHPGSPVVVDIPKPPQLLVASGPGPAFCSAPTPAPSSASPSGPPSPGMRTSGFLDSDSSSGVYYDSPSSPVTPFTPTSCYAGSEAELEDELEVDEKGKEEEEA